MGAKADIGWKTEGEDGSKRHVYAQHIGSQWKFFERPKRRGKDIQWHAMENPPLSDWLELLDALERGAVRRRYMPDDIAEVRRLILERFPDHRLNS